MITTYFKWPQSLTRLLSTPAGPYLSSLAQDLAVQGFSYWILRARLQGAAHFSHWNQQQGRSLEQLHESLLGGFAVTSGEVPVPKTAAIVQTPQCPSACWRPRARGVPSGPHCGYVCAAGPRRSSSTCIVVGFL